MINKEAEFITAIPDKGYSMFGQLLVSFRKCTAPLRNQLILVQCLVLYLFICKLVFSFIHHSILIHLYLVLFICS